MAAANDEDPSVAVARLTALRAEHGPILDAIVSDEGMAASTRALLVAHLREEEDERLAEVAAALGGSTVSPAEVLGAAEAPRESSKPRTRVVPRRGDDGAPAGAGLTVGSMRRPVAASTGWRRDR